MTSGKADEEFFKQRGFGIKMGFGERPALIVIDMLKGFTDSSMPLGANLDKEIEAQKPMIDVAHQRGIPVIFSTVIYNDHDLKDAGLWAIKMKGTLTLKAAPRRSRSIRASTCGRPTACWSRNTRRASSAPTSCHASSTSASTR